MRRNKQNKNLKSLLYAETTLELPGWGGKIHACAVEDLVTITRGLKTRSIGKKRCSAVHSIWPIKMWNTKRPIAINKTSLLSHLDEMYTGCNYLCGDCHDTLVRYFIVHVEYREQWKNYLWNKHIYWISDNYRIITIKSDGK